MTRKKCFSVVTTQQTFVLWRRFQDTLVKTNIPPLELRLQKKSWSRHWSWPYLLNTSSRRLQTVLPRRLQDVFKTSPRCPAKTSSRHPRDVLPRGLQDVLQNCLQDIFKTSSRRLAKMSSRRFREVLNTFLFQWMLFTEQFALITPPVRNLWSVYKICKRDKNFSGFSIFSFSDKIVLSGNEVWAYLERSLSVSSKHKLIIICKINSQSM